MAIILSILSAVPGAAGCAHAPAVRGPRFAVSIESIDGRSVVTKGPSSQPSFLIQVGEKVVRVWPTRRAPPGPGEWETLIETDAEALRSGILIESSWTEAVVHEVTEEELAAGAALFFVPMERRSVVAEVRFRALDVSQIRRPAAP